MFAIRGFAVSFCIFFLLYGALSVLVLGLWRKVFTHGQGHSATRSADLLFYLRLAPFMLAAALTFAFAVPSFLLLEPRAVDESLGAGALVLGSCGAAVVFAGLWKAFAALMQASRTLARWTSESRPVTSKFHSSIPLLEISGDAPPLTAAGVLRPSIWLSRAAEFVLTERELQVALEHEVTHVRRRDNLRKLMLRVVAFPGMAELEQAWREATEIAADDAAVSSASEALDLAAAVIKLSRLVSRAPAAELTTALVYSSADCLNARVERLIAWTEPRHSPARNYSFGYALCTAAMVVAMLVLTYSELLVRVHGATEWLVR